LSPSPSCGRGGLYQSPNQSLQKAAVDNPPPLGSPCSQGEPRSLVPLAKRGEPAGEGLLSTLPLRLVLEGQVFLRGVCVEAKIGRRFPARGAHFLLGFSAGECARQKTYPSKGSNPHPNPSRSRGGGLRSLPAQREGWEGGNANTHAQS